MSSGMFEITHDSLAAKIWEKVSAEEKTLIEVKNFIANSAAMYKARKVLLTKQDLAYIAPYENKLTLDEDAVTAINRSKRYYRNQKISLASVIAAIISALVIGIIIISNANRKAMRAESLAKINESKQIMNAKRADSMAQIANANAFRADSITDVTILQRDSLSEVTTQLKLKQNEVEAEKAKVELEKSKVEMEKAKVVLEKAKSDQQVIETDNTLENTNQLSENPTLALKQAIFLYESIKQNNKLKLQLKKNSFEAFNQIFYVNEVQYPNQINDIAISYDGKNFLIADGTFLPKVWSKDFQRKNSLTGHLNIVTNVVASPTGPHFVTIEKNREAIFWEDDFKYADTANFKDDIRSIKYLNQGKAVLFGFKNGNMIITDLRGKTLYKISERGLQDIQEIVVSTQPGYNFFTRSSDDKIYQWTKKENSNFFESRIVFENNSSIRDIRSMTISPDSDMLLFATEKGIYSADSLRSGVAKFRFEIFFQAIVNLVFKPDHKVIASTANGLVFIYDLESKKYSRLKGYSSTNKITHVIRIPNESRFITVGDDLRLLTWDEDANKPFLYKSQEYKPEIIDHPAFSLDKKTNKWIFKGVTDDIVYFKRGADMKIKMNSNDTLNQVEWIKPDAKNDFISITSEPIIKFNMVYNESALIMQDQVLLSIIDIDKLTDEDNKKLRSKLSISSIVLSECGKFILVKCIQASGKNTYYYIYPTFRGLEHLVKNKNLLNLR